MEESIKTIRMLAESKDVVNYDGPLWKLKNAVLTLPPYNGKVPPLDVAAGPGRGIKICGKYADRWGTFLPQTGPPEWYAEQVQEVQRQAEIAGRDPDGMVFFGGITAVMAPTEDLVDTATQSAAIRWDVASLVSGHGERARFGQVNPTGDDWSYPRDLIPMDWSREDALKIAYQVSLEMVRNLRCCGTPQSVADQLQPYIDAGMNKIMIATESSSHEAPTDR